MTLIANLVIMSYRSKGMINLPTIQNDMINPRPDSLFSHSIRALLCHPTTEWLVTLERIWYKADTMCWFKILSTGVMPLTIKEYIPRGLVLEALFPLNPWGGHKVASY